MNQSLPRLNDGTARGAGDRRDGSVYVYTDEIILAVNVAVASRRPLLLRGPSGSGKSSLARCVARTLGRRYYEEVVTSRTQARDFLWTFDTLRRLNDAHSDDGVRAEAEYVRPGVLWWAFDPSTAPWRGGAPSNPSLRALSDPGIHAKDEGLDAKSAAVVLIDEIDKADPDVPNNLLVPLGSLQFEMHEAGSGSVKVAVPEAAEPPLIFITTNDERELPNAFLRRCIILKLSAPDPDRLVQIAHAQLGEDKKNIYREVANMLSAPAGNLVDVEPPSTAEYLDALRCCLALDVTPTGKPDEWAAIKRVALTKNRGMTAP